MRVQVSGYTERQIDFLGYVLGFRGERIHGKVIALLAEKAVFEHLGKMDSVQKEAYKKFFETGELPDPEVLS